MKTEGLLGLRRRHVAKGAGSRGHRVEAENGQKGIELAQRTRPDVIVLDFNMPVMNGYEMALHLQQRPETSRIPLILNSSEDVNNHVIAGDAQSPLNTQPLADKVIEWVKAL